MGASLLLIVILLPLNVAISWWNAHVAGKAWVDSKVVGGWPRLVVASTAIMSALGFTWAYSIIAAMLAIGFGYTAAANLLLQMTYVAIIVPLLGTGLVITVHSWQVAARRGGVLNYGVAAYNTFATATNTIQAARVLPGMLKDIGKGLAGAKSGDAKGRAAMLAIALTVLCLVAGILTTRAILLNAAKASLPDIEAHRRPYRSEAP